MATSITPTTSKLALLCLVLSVHSAAGYFGYGGGYYNNNQFWNQFWGNNWSFGNNNNNNNGQACTRLLTDCMYQGTLAIRMTARMNGAQTMSIIDDVITNFDLNRDNCITGQEFIAVTTSRGYSVEYARYRFNAWLQSNVGINNVVCPGGISVLALNAIPKPAINNAVNINNNNVQTLVDFCDQNTQRYQTNCDCIQLPTACNRAPFQTTPACNTFRTRYGNFNQCPFSTGAITSAKLNCAAGTFGNANPQLIPLLRILCNNLNQKTPTSG